MNAIRLPYWKLLIEKASGRSLLTRQGNAIWDNLSASRNNHTNLTNLVWWPQDGLNCYTPRPHFHAVHSVVDQDIPQQDAAGNTVTFSRPALDSTYPVCTWRRVSGTAIVRAVLPDGPAPIAFLKILPPADGSPWAYQTASLPVDWAGGLNAKGPGDSPQNGSVAITLRFGSGDRPSAGGVSPDSAGYDPNTTPPASAPSPLFTRVCVGHLWAVVFPQDGSAPFFEKRFTHKDHSGNRYDWVKLHTFADASQSVQQDGQQDGRHEWLVSFVALAGRIAVSISGRDLDASVFVYSETKPGKSSALKSLTIPAAPVSVSGATNDGAPVYVGLRRIGWGGAAGGSFFSTLTLNAAVGDKSEIKFNSFGYIPGLIDGLNNATVRQPTFETVLTGPTTLAYACTVPATDDDREPCALRWVWVTSPRVATPESGVFIDYGAALSGFEEDIAEPAFGGDSTGGSKNALNSLTFSRPALDTIAAANSTDWRADLQAYSPATWILGNYVCDPSGTLTQESETTRIQGYLMRPHASYDEFESGTVTRELHDPSVRLRDPAGFIDTRYHPLDFISGNVNNTNVYGVDAVRYILGQAIDPSLAANLIAYFPPDWFPLFDEDALILGQGKLPANDLPLWSPPYGQYAETWLKEIQSFDFACLYFAGLVPIYGQFSRIIAGCPTWDIYDGADENGIPISGSLPDAQQPWIVTQGEVSFDTNFDFNRFVVWGDPPGGIAGGTDGKPLGAPLLTAQATDFLRVAQSWERTDLSQGGKFYDQRVADQYARTVLAQQGGTKAASHYKVTLPFAKPEVFWGHKLRFHTALSLPEMNGKTLRVLKMSTRGENTGDGGRKATTEFDLIELIELGDGSEG